MFSVGFGLVCCGVAFMVSAALLVRYAKLPPWTHRDLLAFLALLATIGGAIILTLLKWLQTDRFNVQADRLITEIVRAPKETVHEAVGSALSTIIDSLTWDIKLTSIGIIVVLLSLGLVISSRVIKGKFLGNEIEMGTNDQRAAAAAGAAAVAGAAQDTATDIAGGTPVPPAPVVDSAPTSR